MGDAGYGCQSWAVVAAAAVVEEEESAIPNVWIHALCLLVPFQRQ